MRIFAVLLLLAATCSFVPAQIPNPVTPNFLIPPDVPHTKLSHWTDDGSRTRLTLDTPDGILRGFRYAGKNPAAPTILFFNGNDQTISDNDKFYSKLAQLGPTVVAYDYLGYGVSTGSPDALKFRDDGVKVYDKTLADTAGHKVIVYGYSLGTAVATYVASQRPVAALILAAPMATAIEQIRYSAEQGGASQTAIQLIHVGPYVETMLDEVAMIKQSKAPLLVIHGTADKTVSYNEGREVFAASPSPAKYFVKIEGADHMGLPAQMGAFESIKRFLPLVEKE
jgi:pimeloyl-ACP methyl ester carboxylesterase